MECVTVYLTMHHTVRNLIYHRGVYRIGSSLFMVQNADPKPGYIRRWFDFYPLNKWNGTIYDAYEIERHLTAKDRKRFLSAFIDYLI